MSNPSLKGQVAIKLLRDFPKSPTKSLANKAYKENRSLFKSVDEARSALRYWRGNKGKDSRTKCSSREHHRPNGKPGDAFKGLPKSKSRPGHWGPLQVNGPVKALVISDVHIPYHSEEAIRLELKYGKDRGANLILLNGDIVDFFACSFWEKDPRERDLAGELYAAEQFFDVLRKTFPKARIIGKIGNHEDRWERYLFVKAPEICGVPDFRLEKILRFEKYGIEMVRDRRPIRLGKLNVIHGHEYNTGRSVPVSPARTAHLRAIDHTLLGHYHRSSQTSEKGISGNVITCFSIGCSCDLNPDYAPLNNWNLGFGFCEVDKTGAFQVDNLRIIDGKIY